MRVHLRMRIVDNMKKQYKGIFIKLISTFSSCLLILSSCSNVLSTEYDNSETILEVTLESTTIVTSESTSTTPSIEETTTSESSQDWDIQPYAFEDKGFPVIDITEEGLNVTNEGFDNLNNRLISICSTIKELYPTNTIMYDLYRCDWHIISFRIVVLKEGSSY